MLRSFMGTALLSITLLLSFSACNTNAPRFGMIEVEPTTPDNSSIQAIMGNPLEIVLPTTGAGSPYRWVPQGLDDNSPLRLLEEREGASRFPNRRPDNYVPNRVFVFEARAVGEQTLRFTQERVEGREAPPSEVTRTFFIEVLPQNETGSG